MTVSVDYLGSTVQVHLGEFEPFIAQEVDTVTRYVCSYHCCDFESLRAIIFIFCCELSVQ